MTSQEHSAKVRTGAQKELGKFIRCVLTLNLVAPVEAHAGQVRAVLEHLDVACSYVCSYWRQRERNGQERSKDADWCAKNSSGKFIRCVLTMNAPAELEVHAGQVRAALEHLDVACSYVWYVRVADSSTAHSIAKR